MYVDLALMKVSTDLPCLGDSVELVMWSMIEEFCAVLCACLPALRPLLQKVRLLGSTDEGSRPRGQFHDTYPGRRIGSEGGKASSTKEGLVELKRVPTDHKDPFDTP